MTARGGLPKRSTAAAGPCTALCLRRRAHHLYKVLVGAHGQHALGEASVLCPIRMSEGSRACVHKCFESDEFPKTKLLKRTLIYRAVLQVHLLVLQALLAVNSTLCAESPPVSGMPAVNEVRSRRKAATRHTAPMKRGAFVATKSSECCWNRALQRKSAAADRMRLCSISTMCSLLHAVNSRRRRVTGTY